jgi:hypothetical protein
MTTLLRLGLLVFAAILGCTAAEAATLQVDQRANARSTAYQADAKPQSGTTATTWRVNYSPNFIVCCPSWFDGDAAARNCEALSRQLSEKWLGDSALHWKTRCYVVFHPTLASYVQSAGAGSEATAGCTTLKHLGKQVQSRRIDVRLDRPNPLVHALPHELTHAVLAEVVARHSLPRWADEGMATLADSAEKRMGHARDLAHALREGKRFRLSEFVAMSDYPSSSGLRNFYGQGLSLVEFLVERESPQQFLKFAESATATGYDAAIREHYGLNGIDELERAWLSASASAHADSPGLARVNQTLTSVRPSRG